LYTTGGNIKEFINFEFPTIFIEIPASQSHPPHELEQIPSINYLINIMSNNSIKNLIFGKMKTWKAEN
jgi:hypothetical protein